MVGQVRSLIPVRGSAFLSWFAATYCKNMPLSLGTQIAYHLDEYMGLTPFSGQSTIGLAQDSRLGGPARIDMGNPSRDSGFPAYILIYAIPAAEETGQTLADISLEQAQKAVEAALKKSTDMGVKMDIAVVDAGANLKAFARMDGAWLGSIDIAQKKARTARWFDMPTGNIGGLSSRVDRSTTSSTQTKDSSRSRGDCPSRMVQERSSAQSAYQEAL